MKTHFKIQRTLSSAAKKYAFTIALIATLAMGAAAQTNTFPTDGNAGVGTTTPTQKLQVNGAGLFTGSSVSGNTATGVYVFDQNILSLAGSNGRDLNIGAQTLKFFTGTSYAEKMRIDANGNVGIGTTNPQQRLDINYGSANTLKGIAVSETHSSGTTGLTVNNTSTGGSSGLLFNVANSNKAMVKVDNSKNLTIATLNAADSALNTGITMDTNGNVGIGTTSPDNPLTVKASGSSTQGFVVKNNALTQHLNYIGPRGSGGSAQNQGFLAMLDQGSTTVALDSAGPSYFTGGNVGIGNSSPTEKLHVTGNIAVTGTGNITASGTIEGGNIKAKYQDLAEWVPSSEQLSAGTVVVLDTTKSNQVISSTVSYDTRVAGVISAQPGITLGESGKGKVLVATTGRVRVKVDASRGAIQIGDLLVTSDVPGVAMKSEAIEFAGRKMHMPGTIIGKALEPLAKGSGEILVLLSLQ